MKYCLGLSECLIIKCKGQGDAAMEAFKNFLADFGKYETEIETYYDQYMMGYGFKLRIFGVMEDDVPLVEV